MLHRKKGTSMTGQNNQKKSDEKILVTRSSMPPFEEYAAEIRDLWDSHWITNMGVKHEELEKRLCEYLSAEHICLFSNGHMALELSLEAMGLKGEIITTPFTFVSTTWAILRSGCTPVFCDIHADDFTIDETKIEDLITEKTCAILPVQVYGNVCRTAAIEKIAASHGLKVIYDAAHAFGVRVGDRGAASFGDLSMFSFHATKVFNTIEGGAVCFHDPSLSDRLFWIKNFGIQENDVHTIGANSKMNEFQAAMGLCNLRHVSDDIALRKTVSDHYRKRLSGVPGIRLNAVQPDVTPNYAYFPVVFEQELFGAGRADVESMLKQNNIFPRRYFYPCTNEMITDENISGFTGQLNKEAMDAMLRQRSTTPTASKISDQVLTLPIYAGLSAENVDRICDVILSLHRS
jgi:dTDP-4-amino-4,6-dideoxygalactose transaminase